MASDDDDPPDIHPKHRERPRATRPKHSKKDFDAMIKQAWEAGWWCETKHSNYIGCYPPDGGEVVMVPSTPSGSRTIKNLRQRFRRGGLDV